MADVANVEDNGDETVWIVVCTYAGAVQYRGSMEDAREHLNKLAAAMEEGLRSKGITPRRMEQKVVRKPPTGVPNGENQL